MINSASFWGLSVWHIHKIVQNLTSPPPLLPVSKNRHYSTRNQSNLELSQFFSRTKSFSNSFFPYCIKEWSKLDTKIKNLRSLSTFKKALLVFCKTEENSLFNVHNPIGVKSSE